MKIIILIFLIVSWANSSVFKLAEIQDLPQFGDQDHIEKRVALELESKVSLLDYFNQDTVEFSIPSMLWVKILSSEILIEDSSWSFKGKVEGIENSNVFFYHNGKFLNGKIEFNGKVFMINPTGEFKWIAEKINLEILESEPEVIDTTSHDELLDTPMPAPPTDVESSIIDIIVIYSANYALSFDNNQELILAEIQTRIEEAHQIYQNSGIQIELVLLHHQQVDMPDDLTSGTDVANYPIATQLREQYGADLVSFWNINGSAGSASNYSGSSTAAYSTAKKSRIQSGYTFVHEVGHNMGGKHDRQTYVDQGRSSELTQSDYKYGLSFADYRTVMSYDNCTNSVSSCNRIMHFTNPNVNYNGVPTGIAVGNLDPADNARRLNDTRAIISAFRTRQVSLSSSSISISSSSVALSSSSNILSSSSANSGFELTYQIVSSLDDAEQVLGGVVSTNSSDLELIEDSGTQEVGLRFVSVSPRETPATSEYYIQFTTDEVSSITTSLNIFVELNSSCANFASGVSGRALNTTPVVWNPVSWDIIGESNEKQRTPNLAPLIVDLQNSTGWSSGSICFVIQGTGERVAEAWDGESVKAAKLIIQEGLVMSSSLTQSSSSDNTVNLINEFNRSMLFKLVDKSLKFEFDGIQSVVVYNSLGEVLSERKFEDPQSDLKMDISYLTQGNYFVNVKTDSGQFTRKISINN